MAAKLQALTLHDLTLSYERLLTGISSNDEHDRFRPVKQALKMEIESLRLQMVREMIGAGATEQEANEAVS